MTPEPSAPPQSPKASPESVLAAPRRPVTRWNRRYLLVGAVGLASLVAVAFWLGFGGAGHGPTKTTTAQGQTDATPVAPAFPEKYAKGYADPAVQAIVPPSNTAPAPTGGPTAPGGSTAQGAMSSAPATSGGSAAQRAAVDPAVQQAAALDTAARTASPFFAGATSPALSPVSLAPAPVAPGASTLANGPQPSAADAADVQPANGQGDKRRFLAGAKVEDYLLNPELGPQSPWEVKAGTVIPAALLTALNSDLPGEVIAQVTEPVYDHATGRTVLIPQGSRLIGQYDSQVAYGQNRALIAWNRIVMPNGRSINLGSMEGADLAGAAGLQDQVDEHIWQLARGVLLSTVLSVGAASAQDASARSSGNFVVNSAGAGVSTEAEQVGGQITARDLNRQPTLKVRAGWPLRVLVSKDMILAPYP